MLAAFLLAALSPLCTAAEEAVLCISTEYIDGERGDTLWKETPLGRLCADAALDAADADVCILPGGIFVGNIPVGELHERDLDSVFSGDTALYTIRLSAEELKEVLETGFSHVSIQEEYIDSKASAWEGYPQIAGMTVELDAPAPSGERVRRMKLSKGGVLSEQEDVAYILVCTDFVLRTARLSGGTQMGVTLQRALADYLRGETALRAPSDTRISVLGTNDNSLFASIPHYMLIPVAALLFIIRYFLNQRKKTDPYIGLPDDFNMLKYPGDDAAEF